jgi:DNA modification methylase
LLQNIGGTGQELHDDSILDSNQGDSREALQEFPDGHFNLIVTSPPYADARQNHYDSVKPDDYADFMTSFHKEFWRVLADDGSFVMNIKDKVIDGVRHGTTPLRYCWRMGQERNMRYWKEMERAWTQEGTDVVTTTSDTASTRRNGTYSSCHFA